MSIIREHGGNLAAQAIPEGGSIFTLDLPVPSETSAEPEVAAPSQDLAQLSSSRGANLGALHDRAILVVDDEESIRMLLEEGLSAHGLHVDCAANAEAAVALAGGRAYDVLLCDLNLSSAGGGKVSGRDVAERALAATGTEKPFVIFMTGDLVNPDLPLPSPGEPRLLQKPFRISDVLALVQEVCSAKRLENVKS